MNLLNSLNNTGISRRSVGTIDENGIIKITKILSYDLVPDPGFSNAVMFNDLDAVVLAVKRQRLRKSRKEKILKVFKK